MRYTLTLDLGELPGWARDTVNSALEEHQVVILARRDGTTEVIGRDELTVRLACDAACSRVGQNFRELVIDLFA